MGTDARKHVVPTGAEGFGRHWHNDLSLSINDIIPVANATERAQLVADLTAKGVSPSPARPLYVHRTDATAGRRLEVTEDGSTWRTVAGAITAAISYASAWGAYGSGFSSPRLRMTVDTVTLLGGLVRRNAAGTGVAGTEYQFGGGIPAEMRPASSEVRPIIIARGATSHTLTRMTVKPDGGLWYYDDGQAWAAGQFLILPDVTWPAP